MPLAWSWSGPDSFPAGGGGASAGDTSATPNPDMSWITPKMWSDVLKLSKTLNVFTTLPGQINLGERG